MRLAKPTSHRLPIALALYVFCSAGIQAQSNASPDPSDTLSQLIASELADTSIGEAKLRVDQLIDPSSDIGSVRTAVNRLAGETLALAGIDADDNAKMIAMRSVLYEAGTWNDHRPFSYDHDDPQGQNVRHKTMAYYISSRKGNCVTMPTLILMIGELLNLDMTFTTAPQHLLVHFNPSEQPGDDDIQRIEGTSGGFPQRMVWMRQVFPSITDRAIETGVYFAKLNKAQSIAQTGEALMQHLYETGDHLEQAEVAEVILEVSPNDDNAILHRIGAYDSQIRKHIIPAHSSIEVMPPDVFHEFERMAGIVQREEARLLDLGWQPNRPAEQIGQ